MLAVALGMTACKSDPAAPAAETGDSSDASGASTAAEADNGGENGGSTSAESSAGTSAETSAGSETTGGTDTGGDEEPLRFVVLGDGGEGNEAQFRVAEAVEMVCVERGCEFALYLGDNFYDSGVEGVQDEQFFSKFEEPYADLDFPFYVTLGNHDYGGVIGGVFSNEWYKGDYQIEYTNFSEKWTMPAKWYDFKWKDARFISVDTPRMMFDHETQEQRSWISGVTSGASETWKIAFGHHPYISNGSHGNAGNYEGIPWPDTVSGGDVKDFMDQEFCYRIDVYFSGHDHTRQWLEPVCGVEYIVSGAAAKTTELSRRDDNPVFYEDDSKAGFAWVEIDGTQMYMAFYDLDGNLDFERTFSK